MHIAESLKQQIVYDIPYIADCVYLTETSLLWLKYTANTVYYITVT